MKENLYLNGLKIESWELVSGLGENEDDMAISLKDYVLIDKKATETWIGEIDIVDSEKIEDLTRLDKDRYANKRVKIILQVLGPIQRPGR